MKIKLYSILVVYILLFTQAPSSNPVCLDGTIIDSSTILVTTVCITVVMLGYDWWLCMVINISVQYSGGLLPDIILSTQGYYQLLLLFLTFSVLVANPKKLLYTVANPARGLLNREKRTKEKVWQHTPPPPPPTLLVRRK